MSNFSFSFNERQAQPLEIRRKPCTRSARGQGMHPRGQGMVEFALALPVLLMLIMGVIEFGRLLMTYSAVFSAAREASRYGAAVGMNTVGVPFDHDCDGMRAAAVRVGNLGGVRTGDIAIRMLGPDGNPKQVNSVDVGSSWCSASNTSWSTLLGDIVEVTVAVNYAPVVPLVPIPKLTVSGNNGGIRSTASRTIVTDVQVPSTNTGGGGAPITYALNINYVPSDHTGGTVTPSTAANNPDTGPYTAGTIVHLTINPAAGWHFAGWTGPDGALVDAGNNITMDMSKTITANFVQDPYALVISQVGTGTTNPPVGSSLITPGTQVALSATPAAGWNFVGWSGTDISGTNSANPLTITMDKAKNITATFTNSQKFNLTTSVTGNGSVNPASGTYTYGDVVTVTANPTDACWGFTTFRVNGGNSNSTNPLAVTITGPTSILATFQQNPMKVMPGTSTVPAGLNGGSITMDPPGGSYPCDPEGKIVNLKAQPLPGFTFYGWSGVDSSNGLNATVTLTQAMPNRTPIATFVQENYLLTVNILPGSTGTFAATPNTNKFTYGQTVTVNAIAARGYGFSGWTYTGIPNVTVNGSTITINPITANMPLVANFTPVCAPTELIVLTGPALSATSGDTSGTATWQIDNRTGMNVKIEQITINSFTSSDWKDILTFTQATLNNQELWSGNITGNGKANDGYPQTIIPPANSLTINSGTKSPFVFAYTFNDKHSGNTLSNIDISITFSNRCP